ncbi:hypothetical protein PEC301875_06960 [Pectobacterium carotovorum subsp. carotovorum]|nr:hypothetical protein PEC301875_06960 [Pectobacterium carotovorum subsp. carotovorum]
MSAMCTELASDFCWYQAHRLMCDVLSKVDALGVLPPNATDDAVITPSFSAH